MDRLLNFGEPLDIGLLDQVVQAVYQGNDNEVRLAFSVGGVEGNSLLMFAFREISLRRSLQSSRSTRKRGRVSIQF